MVDLLLAGVSGAIRVAAVVVLALLAAVNLIGFMFVAYGWLMDADIHVKGGAVTIVLGLATLVLCLLGIRALVHPRPDAAS